LLDVGREELREYLRSIGQAWREDATNADPGRTRAKIRHDLLPRLAAEFNPDVAGALVRLGGLTRSAVAALEEQIRALKARAVRPGPEGAVTFDRAALAALSPYLRAEVLRRAWRDMGWPERSMDARRWRRLAAWASRGAGALHVGAGVRGEIVGDVVTLARAAEVPAPTVPDPVPLAIPGEALWMGGRIVAAIDPGAPWPVSPFAERLDLDRLAPPFAVDTPRPGDRFDPLGLGGHSMPLADFLRGRRIPRGERSGVPLVRDALGIVWVVGHRIGHRARITGDTRRVVALEFVNA
jgi:tRNA(Ile)-lysidine synthase